MPVAAMGISLPAAVFGFRRADRLGGVVTDLTSSPIKALSAEYAGNTGEQPSPEDQTVSPAGVPASADENIAPPALPEIMSVDPDSGKFYPKALTGEEEHPVKEYLVHKLFYPRQLTPSFLPDPIILRSSGV